MPHPNGVYIVRHPDVDGLMVALDPAVDYPKSDPVVTTYAWAFTPIENVGDIVESVNVEQATAAPGEKRRGPGRPRKTA